MKSLLGLAITLAPCTFCVAQESDILQRPLTPTGLVIGERDADVNQLMAQIDPPVQDQIAAAYDALRRTNFELDRNGEAFRELQKLKDIAPDQSELVKQLAIFAATPSKEEQHPLATFMILMRLELPQELTIRALAPYLETENPTLRSFAREWFHSHSSADPFSSMSANYKAYLEYVRVQVNRNEAIPGPFVKYIYERSPEQALAVFNSATINASDEILLLHKARERAQQGRAPTEQERTEVHRVKTESQKDRQERRKVVLAEHIVSNALWLKKHGFNERFQATMPEAMAELEKLAKHEEWWARMYVVYIMRQNHVLRQDHILRQLAEDENSLVSEAAKITRR